MNTYFVYPARKNGKYNNAFLFTSQRILGNKILFIIRLTYSNALTNLGPESYE